MTNDDDAKRAFLHQLAGDKADPDDNEDDDLDDDDAKPTGIVPGEGNVPDTPRGNNSARDMLYRINQNSRK